MIHEVKDKFQGYDDTFLQEKFVIPKWETEHVMTYTCNNVTPLKSKLLIGNVVSKLLQAKGRQTQNLYAILTPC